MNDKKQVIVLYGWLKKIGPHADWNKWHGIRSKTLNNWALKFSKRRYFVTAQFVSYPAVRVVYFPI
jgi:hypothetical protein